MSNTTDKFSAEVRTRAVRMVLEHSGEYPSRWAAVVSVSQKIGCSAHTLNGWVKKVEVDGGRLARMPSEVAEKLKALERENRELLLAYTHSHRPVSRNGWQAKFATSCCK